MTAVLNSAGSGSHSGQPREPLNTGALGCSFFWYGASMDIRVRVGDLQLNFPSPTQRVAADMREAMATGGRLVTRQAEVLERGRFAVLDFEELPGGPGANGPFGGTLTTLVRRVCGISTTEQAQRHFLAENDGDVKRAFEETPGAITTTDMDVFALVTFNLGEAGWAPGNSFHYLLLKHRGGSILFEPTHYLLFDWARFTIQPYLQLTA